MLKKLFKQIMLPALLAASSLNLLSAQDLPVHAGPYLPTTASLKKYQYPDWFRDAKFGIWAHWVPQAVPRQIYLIHQIS